MNRWFKDYWRTQVLYFTAGAGIFPFAIGSAIFYPVITLWNPWIWAGIIHALIAWEAVDKHWLWNKEKKK